jgi:tetratricopeptide (TPR) repeat protein
MTRMIKRATLLLLLSFTGCATHHGVSSSADINSTASALHIDWQSDAYTLIEVPQIKDVFYLNDDRKLHFLSYYHALENQTVDGHNRLAQYLDNFLSGFTYRGDTYNADMASTEQAGNCLSLAILTKAYASLVGLKVEYRKVNSAPVYSRDNGIISLSSHVQTHIFAPPQTNRNKFSFYFSKVIIDYFPASRGAIGGVVNDDDFVSMYYQNLAAKALMTNDYNLAYSLLAAALQLSSNNIETLNTLAVLHKKAGKPDVAESIYRHILEQTEGSVSVLSNYVILLEKMNRNEDAAVYEDMYMEIEDDNPYRWHDLANEAYGKEKYSKALYLYKKSADMAPYLHENYFGQAKVYFQLGNKNKASKAMEKASELAYTLADEKRYLAKLHTLQHHH